MLHYTISMHNVNFHNALQIFLFENILNDDLKSYASYTKYVIFNFIKYQWIYLHGY